MNPMAILLILLLSLTASGSEPVVSASEPPVSASEPVVSAWIRSRPAAGAELRKVLPYVHEVIVDDRYVEVRSAGLSLLYLGPFQNPLTGDGGLRDLRFRIPRNPVLQNDAAGQLVGPGVMGVFLNDVPLYNGFADASYLGLNMWHLMRVFIEPEADGVLWLHVRVLLVLDQGEGRGSWVGQ